MAKHINDFNIYITKMEKVGRNDYNEECIYTIFTESILDNDYNSIITDAEKKGYSIH